MPKGLLSPLRGPLYRSESRLATLPKGAKEGAKAKGLSVPKGLSALWGYIADEYNAPSL